jgi:CheY-like chemotaxis protein
MQDENKSKKQLIDELNEMRRKVAEFQNSEAAKSDIGKIENKDSHHSLFQHMLEGFAYCKMLFDANGAPQDWVYLDVNPAFEQLTGLKNIVGQRVTKAIPRIKETCPELFDIYGRVSTTGKAEKFEFYVEPLKIWFCVSAYSPAKDHFVAFFENITERKRIESELREHTKELEDLYNNAPCGYHSLDANGIFVRINDTELQWLGYSQLLLDDKKKGEPGYDDLQAIIRTGEGGADLVKKLVAFAQQSPISTVPLDLNLQVSQMSALLSRTLPLVVQVDLDLTDGPTTILADHSQIDQLVVHLAVNASEAMPLGGRLKIATKTVSLDDEYCRTHNGVKPGGYVTLSVSDTGIGMDKETLARIFDPFFSTKEKGSTRGTGLGLSVVQGIVRQHGGHITCESDPGKGTEFKVYFPAIESQRNKAEMSSPSEETRTVLLVESEPTVTDFGRRILTSAGYTVITATSGRTALEIYRTRNNDISLVILDLFITDMSGRDCLMELLKIDPKVKALVACGKAPEDQLHKEISLLVKGFIHKPFAIAELVNMTRSVLDSE